MKLFESFEEYLSELFVGPRDYKTYRKDEWDFELIAKLYKDYYGIDIIGEEKDGALFLSDLDTLLNHYGATHHQGSKVLKSIVKILMDKNYTILNNKNQPVNFNRL